jgi:N-acetylmuramoyl-L-alanine amidase
MKVISKGNFANVREKASVKSNVIGRITKTEKAEYINDVVADGAVWCKVELNGKIGFVRWDVCEKEKPKGTKIDFLVIHCTATPEGREVTKHDIIKWHTSPRSKGGRGWSVPGYSELINLKGELISIHPYNDDEVNEPWEITNGASGINSRSRHIVYAGGCDKAMKPKDTRNEEQKETLMKFVLDFVKKHPNIKVAGHYHFANKACPSFNVESFCKEIGLSDINIYKK